MSGLKLHVHKNDSLSNFAICSLSHSNQSYEVICPSTHRVPTLETPLLAIEGAQAIARWAAKDSPLYPSDPKQAALVDQWMDTIYTDLYYSAKPVWQLLKDASTAQQLNASTPQHCNDIEFVLEEVIKALTPFEKQLKSAKFLCGTSETLADLALFCEVGPLFKLVFNEKQKKALVKVGGFLDEVSKKNELKKIADDKDWLPCVGENGLKLIEALASKDKKADKKKKTKTEEPKKEEKTEETNKD